MGIQGFLTSLVLTLFIGGYMGLGLILVAKWMGSYPALEEARPTSDDSDRATRSSTRGHTDSEFDPMLGPVRLHKRPHAHTLR